MKYRIVLLFVAVAMFFCSCHHDEKLPEGIMDTSEMIDFMTDVYILEGYFAIENNHNYDTVSPEALRAYDEMLRKHGVNREQADSSLGYYAERPELFAEINDAALRRLEKETKSISVPERPVGVEIKLNK